MTEHFHNPSDYPTLSPLNALEVLDGANLVFNRENEKRSRERGESASWIQQRVGEEVRGLPNPQPTLRNWWESLKCEVCLRHI